MNLNRTLNPLNRVARKQENENWEKLERKVGQINSSINDLVLESGGDSNLEVVQARGGKPVLNERLDEIEDDVSSAENKLVNLDQNKADKSDFDDFVEDKEFKGVLLAMTSNKNISNATWTVVNWEKAEYNLSGFWSSGSPSRIVIPQGVKKVRLNANILWESNSDGYRRIRMRKNGQYTAGLTYVSIPAGGTSPVGGVSSVIEVTQGDYLELEVFQSSGDGLSLRADPYTYFGLEVVEYSKK